MIDMESRLTIGCAGALITYIKRRQAVEHQPNDTDAVEIYRISTVEMFSLKAMMYFSFSCQRYIVF